VKTQDMKNNKKRYILISQVHDNNLHQRITKKHKNENLETVLTEINKEVLYYELLFDIIHETHMHLIHLRDVRSHKTHIDNLWWGCTEDAIKIYRDLCPECLRKAKMSRSKEVQQLQFMFSETFRWWTFIAYLMVNRIGCCDT
jgi:hypothetical protein